MRGNPAHDLQQHRDAASERSSELDKNEETAHNVARKDKTGEGMEEKLGKESEQVSLVSQ